MAKKTLRKREKTEHYFDYSMLFIVLFLVAFGLIMIYSASSYGNDIQLLKRQLIAAALGLVLMGVLAFIPYHFWEGFYGVGYAVAAVLLILLPFIGKESHGATRWIQIPGIGFNLQPAEVAKIASILFIAVMICKMGKSIRTWKGFFLIMAAPAPLAAMIYFLSDNLSSALIVMAITAIMVFVASPDYKKFILFALAGIALAALVVYIVVAMANKQTDAVVGGFRGARILVWLDPNRDPTGKGLQILQGLYAIGSGGIWGKGLGESMQKLGSLPESQNDMIFSIICEELGLFGAIAVILLFVILLWRMMIVANNAPDLFGSMLVVGVMGHIAVQTVLNIAVVTNSMPNTGISLPFISYGGSSVLFLLIEMGLVMSVSRGIKLKDA